MRQTRSTTMIMLASLALAACSSPSQGRGAAQEEQQGFMARFIEPEEVTVPSGTVIEARLAESLSSGSVAEGTPFAAEVTSNVSVGGNVVIPEGSSVYGVVSEVVPAKKGAGNAKMVLRFTELELPDGSTSDLTASLTQRTKSEKGRNAAIIGGSAAGGALLGKIIGKDTKGAVVGSIVGGAIGTGVVLSKDGEQVNLPAGTLLAIRLDRSAKVPVRES